MKDEDYEHPEIQERISYQLFRTVHALGRRFQDEMGDRGINFRQGAVLRELFHFRDSGLTATDLRHKLGVTAASMSKILQQMEQDGFVHRLPHPDDARAMLVYLDERGRKQMQVFPQVMQAIDDLMLDGFSADERAQFASFVRRVRENLDDPEKKFRIKIMVVDEQDETADESVEETDIDC